MAVSCSEIRMKRYLLNNYDEFRSHVDVTEEQTVQIFSYVFISY